MRIEEGKYYRAANGGKAGPMKPMSGVFIQEVVDGYSWNPDGTCYAYMAGDRSDHHLVAEWFDSPIITETVRRIKPGVYGRLWVDEDTEGYASVALIPMLSDDDWSPSEGQARSFSAPELRELARVALEIAEYLDNA